MSAHPIRNAALVAISGIGAMIALSSTIKPSRTRAIAGAMQRDLDAYNSSVHVEQDPWDTLLNRQKIMDSEKLRKPWNMSVEDRQRLLKKE